MTNLETEIKKLDEEVAAYKKKEDEAEMIKKLVEKKMWNKLETGEIPTNYIASRKLK